MLMWPSKNPSTKDFRAFARRSPGRHVERLGTSLSSTDLPDGLDARMDRPFGTIVLVEKPLCAKTNFLSVFNVIWLVQRSRKIFRFTILKIRNTSIAIPPHSEGRFANVTDAGRAAVDATARLTGDANADGEDVWS